MGMQDDVDAPDGFDIDGDVHMESAGEVGEDEEEDDEKEEEVVVDEDEEENEDNGKEPRTIGQGEMVNTSADDVVTMVDDEPTVRLEQGQEMREHTPWLHPLAPAPQLETLEPPPRPRTPETHTLSALEFSGRVTPQKPRPAVPPLREAEAAGNTSDVDVEQQLLSEWAGGDGHPNVPLPNVPLPDVPLPDVPRHEVGPDGSVGEE
jgi:hypothetical protein